MRLICVGGPNDGEERDVSSMAPMHLIENLGVANYYHDSPPVALTTATYLMDAIHFADGKFRFLRHDSLTPLQAVALVFDAHHARRR